MRAGAFAPGYEMCVRAAGRLRVGENTEKSPHLRGIALTKVPRRMRAGAFAPGYEGFARRAFLPSPLERGWG